MMAAMTVQDMKDAIRLAESIGDLSTAEELKKKLQHMTINEG